MTDIPPAVPPTVPPEMDPPPADPPQGETVTTVFLSQEKAMGLDGLMYGYNKMETGEVFDSTGRNYGQDGNDLMFEGLGDMLEAVLIAENEHDRRVALHELGGAVYWITANNRLGSYLT